MIDPINPGPAGSSGPAGMEAAPPGPGRIDSVLQYGTAVISQAVATALGSIQTLIGQVSSTIQAAVGLAAGQVTTGLNAVQTTVDLAAAQAAGSAQAKIAAATPASGPGGSQTQGVIAGQYPWEFWSPKTLQGWDRPELLYKPGALSPETFCFRGGYASNYDALNAWDSYGPLPLGPCPLPGGPAIQPGGGGNGGPGECPAGYQVWEGKDSANQPVCTIVCAGTTGPAGSFPFGPVVDLAGAQALVGTLCGKPVIGPTGGGPQYYAGCLSGKAVSWLATDPAPQGVSSQVGPFPDAVSAINAAGSCLPPPPPTGGQQGTGAPCCDPATGAVKLPDCIQIDLCDWNKFYEATWRAIKKGLCEWVQDPECACPLKDSDRWLAEDCDGQATTMMQGWMGRMGGIFTGSGTADDIIQAAASAAAYGPGELGDGIGPPN